MTENAYTYRLELDPPTEEQRKAGPVLSFDATISTETEISRYGMVEVLSHADGAVDLSRAADGLALLINHDSTKLAGRVRNLRVENRRLRGRLDFDGADPEAAAWAGRVERGVATDVSVSAALDPKKLERKEQDGMVRLTAHRWTPIEASIVSVGADPAAGIGRNAKGITMAGEGDSNVVNFDRGREAGIREGEQATIARLAETSAFFSSRAVKGEEVSALERQAMAGAWPMDRVQAEYTAIVERMAAGGTAAGVGAGAPVTRRSEPPAADYGRDPWVQAGADQRDKWAEHVERSIMLRSGMVTDREERRKLTAECEFAGATMLEIARSYVGMVGGRLRDRDPRTIVDFCLNERVPAWQRDAGVSQTASDFVDILANVANKAALRGYDETPETWRMWCRVGQLPDFKQGSRVALSSFTSLDEVPDGGNYKQGKFSDVAEPIQLAEYAKNFTISRRALINDDLDQFTRVPMLMGRAAARTVGDKVYTSVLKGAAGVGPTLSQDATALFDASTHANYVTSGAAPSVSTLDAGRTSMALQTDPSGLAKIGIRPKYLIVPVALETAAEVLIMSTKDPAGSSSGSPSAETVNPFTGKLEIVAEHRLDASAFKGSTGWYLAADPGQIDTLEVAFLNGVDAPYIREEEQITRSGVTFLVRLDFGVAALDYRGLYYNDGD